MFERVAGLVVLVALLSGGSTRALAQSAQRGALADAWLYAALDQQSRQDEMGRYLAAPFVAAGGTALLVAPPFLDLRPGSRASFMSAGALFLSAAIGVWASPEYDAQRWYTRLASLGFVALGVGAMFAEPGGCNADPFSADAGCSAAHRRLDRGFFTVDFVETSLFLSIFLVDLIIPPRSATALVREVRVLRPDARYDRVLDFLQQRERWRRTMSYVAVPTYFGLAGGLMWAGTGAATPGGRVVTYGLGIGAAAIGVGSLIYEVLRVPDWQRMQRGEGPSD